jgi:16S rRNA (cytosine1402-N4)-methyltransferase
VSIHEPVLLKEVVQYLDPHPGGFYIDGTMNGGGHALAILKHIVPSGMLLGVDWDARVLERGTERISASLGMTEGTIERVLRIAAGNYADLPQILREQKLPKADGLLLDLGFSSEQLESGRGFSFLTDEPLLMTYSDDAEPAYRILARLTEKELADAIYELGGERYSRRIAKAIKEKSKRKRIERTGELAETIRQTLPRGYERGRIDPATRTFQALRIMANRELENVDRVIGELQKIVKPGGRVAIITFHSLEDRAVKNAFREMAKAGKAELLMKKPVAATREEIAENPRSRSAKLRAITVL